MRIITVRKGNFKGEHKVYDSPAEAAKEIIVSKLPWHSPDVAIGDWVVADDGYVVQCLSRSYLINKRHRNGQFTDCFRFPQGSFGVYVDALGNRHVTKNFYAAVTNNSKGSLGNTPTLGRYMPIKKREFVMWMSMGRDPFTAYVKAFKPFNRNVNYITMQINKLLTDELVKEELMEAMKTFVDQIEAEIKATSTYLDLKDLLVKRTAALIVKPKDSDKMELMVLTFVFNFLGTQIGVVIPQKSTSERKAIQEADYQMIPPPQLGRSED